MRTSISLCALVASAGFAFAADPSSRPSGVTLDVKPEWTGAYVGGTLGANTGGRDHTLGSGSYLLPPSGLLSAGSLADNSAATNALTGNNVFRPGAKLKSGEAFEAGLFGGYQRQINSVVVGLDADFNYGRQNGKAGNGGELDIFGTYAHPTCATCVGDTATADGALRGAVRSNMLWNSGLRLRAGVLATDQMLVFATAGVAVGAFHRSITASGSTAFLSDETPAATQATHTFSGTKKADQLRLGWTLGVGVDYRVAANWNVRAEYRYADFGSSTLTAPVAASCSATVTGACATLAPRSGSLTARFTDTAHAMRVGLAYQFGASSVAVLARY